MLGLHRSLPVFQQPPCICNEIEGRVREAIAMRDEMAKWPTPLEEWVRLQQMLVLTMKPEPEPKRDDWSHYYKEALGGRLSTHTVQSVVVTPVAQTANPYRLGTIYDDVPMTIRLLPGESFEVGTILTRGGLNYQIVERLFDNTNCVRVKRVRV